MNIINSLKSLGTVFSQLPFNFALSVSVVLTTQNVSFTFFLQKLKKIFSLEAIASRWYKKKKSERICIHRSITRREREKKVYVELVSVVSSLHKHFIFPSFSINFPKHLLLFLQLLSSFSIFFISASDSFYSKKS